MPSSLFVVAAYTPDAHNTALLLSTLESISRFHPASPILAVDRVCLFRVRREQARTMLHAAHDAALFAEDSMTTPPK